MLKLLAFCNADHEEEEARNTCQRHTKQQQFIIELGKPPSRSSWSRLFAGDFTLEQANGDRIKRFSDSLRALTIQRSEFADQNHRVKRLVHLVVRGQGAGNPALARPC